MYGPIRDVKMRQYDTTNVLWGRPAHCQSMKMLPYILLFLIICLSAVAGEDLYDEAVSILKKARKESDYIMVDALLVRHLAEVEKKR